MSSLSILIIYRHYWPDTPPYASMLKTLAEGFVAAGHKVTILTEQPCHKTNAELAKDVTHGDLSVARVSKLPFFDEVSFVRNIDTSIFPARALFKSLALKFRGKKYDYVISATIPPVINGYFASLGSSVLKAKFIYHVQDIYPEIALSSNMIKKNTFLEKTLSLLERKTTSRMHAAVTLSEDMKETLVSRGIPKHKIEVINNFMLESFETKEEETQESSDGLFKVIFAGNIGRFQGLETFVKAALLLQPDEKIQIQFLGDGHALEELKSLSKNHKNIVFLPRVKYEKAQQLIQEADMGIVSIEESIEKLAYPSKIMTYLGLGTPIITTISKTSEIGTFIDSNNVGVCVSKEPAQILDEIRRISNDHNKLDFMKNSCTDVFSEHFTPNVAVSKWLNILK